jgi:hypothetical protein
MPRGQHTCALCGGKEDALNHALGRMMGPLGNSSRWEGGYYVHRLCALWSSEVWQVSAGIATCPATRCRQLAIQCRQGVPYMHDR